MNQPETYSAQYIRHILRENKRIASVGVSLNPIRPSFLVARWLSLRGYSIIPVNPRYSGQSMWGNITYGQIRDITQEIASMEDIFNLQEMYEIKNQEKIINKNLKKMGYI